MRATKHLLALATGSMLLGARIVTGRHIAWPSPPGSGSAQLKGRDDNAAVVPVIISDDYGYPPPYGPITTIDSSTTDETTCEFLLS